MKHNWQLKLFLSHAVLKIRNEKFDFLIFKKKLPFISIPRFPVTMWYFIDTLFRIRVHTCIYTTVESILCGR